MLFFFFFRVYCNAMQCNARKCVIKRNKAIFLDITNGKNICPKLYIMYIYILFFYPKSCLYRPIIYMHFACKPEVSSYAVDINLHQRAGDILTTANKKKKNVTRSGWLATRIFWRGKSYSYRQWLIINMWGRQTHCFPGIAVTRHMIDRFSYLKYWFIPLKHTLFAFL